MQEDSNKSLREQNCATFLDMIDHLTDTHICDSYYNSMHSAWKANTSHTTSTDLDDDSNDDSDLLSSFNPPVVNLFPLITRFLHRPGDFFSRSQGSFYFCPRKDHWFP
jgi:hypothetical protein